jgi:hypothetical protein
MLGRQPRKRALKNNSGSGYEHSTAVNLSTQFAGTADSRRVRTLDTTKRAGSASSSATGLPWYFAEDLATSQALERPDFSHDLGDSSLESQDYELPPDVNITLKLKEPRFEKSVW